MAISSQDKAEIERIAKKEIKDFLESTQAHTIVMKIIQKELGNKKIDEKMVELATKVVVELYRTLWQRKDFWASSLKSVR